MVYSSGFLVLNPSRQTQDFPNQAIKKRLKAFFKINFGQTKPDYTQVALTVYATGVSSLSVKLNMMNCPMSCPPYCCPPEFYIERQVGRTILKLSYFLNFCGTPSCLKVIDVWGTGAGWGRRWPP